MDINDIPLYPFDVDDLENDSFKSDDLFYRRAVPMIEYAHNEGMDIITLFRIIVNSEEMYLNLPKKVWVSTLHKAIEHFELCEDYEMCSETNKILSLFDL